MRRSAVLAAACMASAIVGCGDLEEYGTYADVFQATFGTRPPPAIRGLRAYGRAFGDNSTCYLRFMTPRAQLDGLIGPGFAPITADEFESSISGAGIAGPTPPWWKPLAGTPTVFLRSGGFHPGFSRGRALVSYDPASGVAHVYWDGLD